MTLDIVIGFDLRRVEYSLSLQEKFNIENIVG